jgi:hypothetical protein
MGCRVSRVRFQEFVTGTDENLAKAATQLGNLVKGLQDTLDDFDPIGK